jgi:hypothetical protein
MPKYRLHVRMNYFKNATIEVEADSEEHCYDLYQDPAGAVRQLIDFQLAENPYIDEGLFALKAKLASIPIEE